MRDVEFMAKLLALDEPWQVHQVVVTPEHKRLDVWLKHRLAASFACPECGRTGPVYDHLPSRRWRHLDHGQFLTWLHARVPRVSCPKHGVRQVAIPWALPRARFTLPFEGHVIDTLLETNVLGASRLLNLSWDEAWHVMERAVARGLRAKKRRTIPLLGVDEKSFAKRHRYVTLVCDLKRGTVEYIAADRKKTSLDAYYQSLTQRQLAGIQAVAMDMWEPFINSTVDHLPGGRSKIVFDRYHIMAYMNKAVDQVRRGEHRLLQEAGDDTLKGTKYLWLFAQENVPAKRAGEFARLRAMHLRTGRAWAIKEALRHLWDYQRKGWALRYWKDWYFWATHSRLKPVVKVAKMIQAHLDNVLTYCDHRITNATSEGLNSKIQTVKKTPTVSATGTTSRRPSFSTAGALPFIRLPRGQKADFFADFGQTAQNYLRFLPTRKSEEPLQVARSSSRPMTPASR
jgi:transposase